MTGRIQIRAWLAKANGYPRIADVEVLHRTRKAIEVKGHGAVESPVYCFRCRKDLTHPISQQIGCGEVCAGHMDISWSADTSPEAIAELKARLVKESTFQGWIPISQIEEMQGFAIEDVPHYTRTEESPEEEPEEEQVEIAERSRIRFTIADWLMKDKGLGKHCIFIEGQVRRVTEKALLIRISLVRHDAAGFEDFGEPVTTVDGKPVVNIKYSTEKRPWEMWLPKSQIKAEVIRKAPKLVAASSKPTTVNTIQVTVGGQTMSLADYEAREDAGIDIGQELNGDLDLEAPEDSSEYQKMCDAALAELGI